MADLLSAWHRYRRQNRFLLGAFVVLMLLSAGAFYVLQRTQEVSPEELTNRLLFFVLWYLDISLILILSFILARNLIRLAVERRAGVLGSRFRTKLVLTYVGLTFVPAIFIFLIATNLFQRSIDRWFSAPVEETLRSGAALALQLRVQVDERLRQQVALAAEALGDDPDPRELPRLRRTLGVDLIALYTGDELLEAVSEPRRISSTPPPLQWEKLQPSGVWRDRWRGGLLVRAWTPTGRDMTVVAGEMLPRDLLQNVDKAIAAHSEFTTLNLERGTITATMVLVFLAVTLFLLFATVWVGLYLSRRFTEPLLAVAEATRRVAEGNQLEEVVAPASDEVAVLVDSFNAMVRRVRATESEIRSSNEELATLLATVPTGVLTVDANGERFRPNPAAARLLGELGWARRWLDIEELQRPGLIELHRRLLPGRSQEGEFEVDVEVEGSLRHLEVTRAALPGGGWVVAIDDLTQLIRAQRHAAWSEVAQRIAHEIMNPLTPIQLAAERIQRWTGRLEGEVREIVSTGCEAIIAHVTGLKELVGSFRQYARMPAVDARPSSLGRILREVCSLYDGMREGLEVRLVLPDDELRAVVDPVLLRQALVNLLDNAADAMTEAGTIEVSAGADGGNILLEVSDTGVGLPTDDPETLLRPFYSTKGRGSGMGLALVHRIVTDHGGTLDLENRSPTGTRVRISLPDALATGQAGKSRDRSSLTR